MTASCITKNGYTISENPNEFFERLSVTIHKQKEFILKIGDQIIQKFNFYIIGVILISKKLAGMYTLQRERYREEKKSKIWTYAVILSDPSIVFLFIFSEHSIDLSTL